jgi:hypothetical protein
MIYGARYRPVRCVRHADQADARETEAAVARLVVPGRRPVRVCEASVGTVAAHRELLRERPGERDPSVPLLVE